jgi:predicted RecA/RadA family phage recombinase
MATEALFRQRGASIDFTPSADLAGGQVLQVPDGRAAVATSAIASGSQGAVAVEGIFRFLKAADIYLFQGQEVFWDYTNNCVTFWLTSGKGFFLGTVQTDAIGTASTVDVAINVRPNCVFNARIDPARTAIVRTAGVPYFTRSGGSHIAEFSLTAEAQKLDLLSLRSIPIASKFLFAAVFTVVADCDADVGDVSIGVADGTHASDADSIVTSALFHLNLSGADLKIYGESDNVTAEVNATDTTKVFAVGTPVHVLIDGRSGDGSALAYYVNGLRVLSSTAFTIAGAAGPIKALFHLEKSSNDSPGSVALDDMKLWLAETAA